MKNPNIFVLGASQTDKHLKNMKGNLMIMKELKIQRILKKNFYYKQVKERQATQVGNKKFG
ncbi:hypothetical protein HMPREF2660_09480 [Weeksella sp. HMSC059D05]|nr:hypothetical protein HMPREF2660_09480 [Weeksella sp. HMSC059D05]